MAALAWAGPALEDLRQTYQFIARDSRQYAGIMVRRIHTAVSSLRDFPKRGRVVPEFPEGPYREILVGSYRVV
jgi:plasmid stabilization system protein ParE